MITINYKKLRSKNITAAFWLAMNTMLSAIDFALPCSESEHAIVNYIKNKTFGFKKLSEKFNTREAREYYPVLDITIYRIKAKLLQKNILIDVFDGKYCLNIYGIACLYKEIFSKYYASPGFIDVIINQTESLLETVCIEKPHRLTVNKERKMKLEQVLKENYEHKAQKRKAAREKRMKNTKLNAKMINSFTAELCAEANVLFNNDPWTDKEYGQAANWLKSYQKNGSDPKETLQEICSKWKDIYYTARKGKYKYLSIPEAFRFSEYYKHRNAIKDMLLTGLKHPELWEYTHIHIDKDGTRHESIVSVER